MVQGLESPRLRVFVTMTITPLSTSMCTLGTETEIWITYTSRSGKTKERSDMIVRTCFSRDGGKEKYVQDMLWNDKALIFDLVVNQNAIVYICGSSGQMPTQVKLTFIEITKTIGNDENAEQYVNEMIKSNRYIQETW